ncbi:hypothetical protein [Rhizobium sp. RCC_161_2]
MGMNLAKDGAADTTDQSSRWEGPLENTPRGYTRANDNLDISNVFKTKNG